MNESPTTPETSPVGDPAAVAPTSVFRRHRAPLIACASVLAILLAGGGVATGVAISSAPATTSAAPQMYTRPAVQDTSTSLDVTAATDAQEVGVVTILTTLYFEPDAQAAGTGMILTSDGEILTNNHVIEGATSIEVTVESTGKTYTADVVGSDAVTDVAVLKLVDASGLDTVQLDSSSSVAIGDAVASVGNAEGTGDLVVASGVVDSLDESITVSNELTGEPANLTGLLEVDADVVSGDSGGPLMDADGEVVGMVTAASSGSRNITGYAIPIATALAVVDQIEAGTESGTVTLGVPAFLGVTVSKTSPGTVASVLEGMPAAAGGLVAGDVITAVDGVAVATTLSALIGTYEPGDSVTISYTDTAGVAQTTTVTLVAGPAS